MEIRKFICNRPTFYIKDSNSLAFDFLSLVGFLTLDLGVEVFLVEGLKLWMVETDLSDRSER